MEPGLDMGDLARRVRELLSTQGFDHQEVIHFATLLLEGVVDEVKDHRSPVAAPQPQAR